MTIRSAARTIVFTATLVSFLSGAGIARAQDDDHGRSNPCVEVDGDDAGVVYDAGQGLCWLADANLAGDPEVRAAMSVAGINPNGTMDWDTALKWVDALNRFDGGRGYLGHSDWQLPATPKTDTTCSANNDGSFGALCTGSAMGYLYANVLGRTYPDSIVPDVINRAGPFRKLVPALYWSSDSGGSQGEHTFSFATDAHFTNTTKYNFLHVLPMAAGAIGTPPAGSGLLPYTDGPAAGKAVYDSLTGFSWALDGNLASTHRFGVSSTTTITTDDGRVLTVPLVDADGAMLFDTANGPGGWIDAMNAANYAGSSAWEIPFDTAFDDLFAHLTIGAGSVLFESDRRVEPFRNFQPFFYWACERGDTSRQAPCDPGLNPPNNPVDNGPMRWSFDFDEGFQGTDKIEKQFYVEVYYPAPRR